MEPYVVIVPNLPKLVKSPKSTHLKRLPRVAPETAECEELHTEYKTFDKKKKIIEVIEL